MGTTSLPQEGPGDTREAHKASLPSAYILVIPNGENPLFEMLQTFLDAAAGHGTLVALDSGKAAVDVVDSWLEHKAAAEYLGVGLSTLYRYVEGEQIESRKFGGRLEYRLSSLDEFKARRVLSARRSRRECSVIFTASHYRFEIDTFAKLKVARSLGLVCDGFDSMPPMACGQSPCARELLP